MKCRGSDWGWNRSLYKEKIMKMERKETDFEH